MKKSEFEKIVNKTFWGLETKYGFKKTETTFQPRGCLVRYQNTTTELVLNYEIGRVPWLAIADITSQEEKRSTLEWLLVEQGIESMSLNPDTIIKTTLKIYEKEKTARR